MKYLNKLIKESVEYYNTHKILLLMFGIFGIFFIFALYYKNDLLTTQKQKETFSSDNGVLTMYHAHWCPHCKSALPEFKLASKENDTKIECREVESEEPEFNLLTEELKEKIQGFPTYIFSKDGVHEVYTGGRDHSSILKFLSAH